MRRTRQIPHALAVALGLLIFAFPVYWMLRGALISEATFAEQPITWFPSPLDTSAFGDVFGDPTLTRTILNTILVAGVITAGNVLFDSLAGYAFARIRFRGRNVVFVVFLATLAVPPEVLIIPQFLIVRALGLYDTFPAIVLPGLASPLSIFLMRQFFLKVPIEIEEAAKVDGAGRLRIFFSIAMPMAKPAVATVAVINFIAGWESYIWPLVATSPAGRWDLMQTLIARSVQSSSAAGIVVDWPQLMASSLIATLPVLLVFVFAQRWFVAGLTGGALKG
jgi:multiple sugar transport system permease protein